MNLDSIIDIVALDLWNHTTTVIARHNITDNTDWENAMSNACDLAGHVSTANGTDTECQVYVVEQPIEPVCDSLYWVARAHADGTSVWDNVRAECSREAVHGWFPEEPF